MINKQLVAQMINKAVEFIEFAQNSFNAIPVSDFSNNFDVCKKLTVNFSLMFKDDVSTMNFIESIQKYNT